LSTTLPRTRLLARLTASEPRVVRLWAPCGYGKSTLARLYARRFERYAVCDCAGVREPAAFAARVLAALADEGHDDGAIARTRVRLHATGAPEATWGRALLDVWRARTERALLILENAEAVADKPAILALLTDLLATRPAERVVLISSQTQLPLRLSYYVAPHQILTLAARDLRFDRAESAAVFEGTDVAPQIVERIVRLADGWPIVLLLLARFAHYEADLERLVGRLETVALVQLHQQLTDDVLSALTPEMMAVMLAAAAIPRASLEDISAATGIAHVMPVVDGLARLPGFISSSAGGYETHPLLLEALRTRNGADLSGCVLRAARASDEAGDELRAAELYALAGDRVAAAGALDRLPAAALEQPSPRLVDAFLEIELPILCRHPNVWIAILPFRRQDTAAATLHVEAARLLEALAPDASAALRRRLTVRLAMLALECGAIAEAHELIAAAGMGCADDGPEERRLLLMTSATVAAKQGCFSEAERLVEEADVVGGARHLRFETERALIAVERARLHGDWAEWLKIADEALLAAQRSGITTRIADALREVAAAAWYGNDNAREAAARQLLADWAGAEAAYEPLPALQGALAATERRTARELFERAIDESDASENDFLRVMIRVSAALLMPELRRLLLEARVIAQRIESAPLQASIELLIDSPEPHSYGMFAPLAARVGRSALNVRHDLLRIYLLRGEIRRGAELLPVSDRGFELLVALALLPAGTSKEALAAAIWPALDGDAAGNALKMCVSRTRAQLGDKEAIRSTKRGYVLSEAVAVDAHELERLARDVHGSPAFAESTRRTVEEAERALGARQRSYAAGWAWFAPHDAHLDDLLREFRLALAKDAFRRDGRVPASAGEQVPIEIA
jgi:hypothetical protein